MATKEKKMVRIVVEVTPDVQYLLRNVAAKRGEKLRETFCALVRDAAKTLGIEAPKDAGGEE